MQAKSNHSFLYYFFNFILVYYFIILIFYDGGEVESFTSLYFILLFPVIIFCATGLYHVLVLKRFYPFEKSSFVVLLFTLSSCTLALLRLDFIGIASVALFGLTIFVILHLKIQYSIKLINYLYLFGIIFSIPMFYLGMNPYGFIPGMSGFEHNIEALAVRISIFPGVASSIQVSFLILLINLFHGPKLWRWALILLAIYYIYFGVSRLMLISLLLFLMVFILTKFVHFKGSRLFSDFLPFFFVSSLIFFMIGIGEFVSMLIQFDFISKYFLRGLVDADEILRDVARLDIWASHFDIFLNNPLGISSREHSSISAETDYGGSGSESFLTRIFVVHGISGLFMFVFIYLLIRRSVADGDFFGYLISFSILLIGLFYGSSFNVYNFFFLVLISSLTIKFKK